MDKFRQANALTKATTAAQIDASREAAKGTNLLPRDLLIAAMYGRLWAINVPGEGTFYSMAARQDVSDNLDVVAQFVGDVLVRGTDFWQAAAQGSPGDVLTQQAAGLPAAFLPTAGGGGGRSVTTVRWSTLDTGAEATKGWSFTPLFDTTVTAAVPRFTGESTETFEVQIWTFDGTKLLSKIATSDQLVNPPGGGDFFRLDFAAQVSLAAGTTYIALLVRVSGLGTDVLRANRGLPLEGPGPFAEPLEGWVLASADPQPNDTPSKQTGKNLYAVNLVYTI